MVWRKEGKDLSIVSSVWMLYGGLVHWESFGFCNFHKAFSETANIFVRPGAVSISISAVEAKLLQEATPADS